MRNFLLIIFLLSITKINGDLLLWPKPRDYSYGTNTLVIDDPGRINY